MAAKPFLDTNVLIYAFAAGDPRQPIAEAALSQGGVISVQVLNEFANVSSRKLGLSWSDIDKRVEVVRALVNEPAPLTVDEHENARRIARARKIGFYDALIIASAQSAGCDVLLSEDLQSGAKFGGVLVRNPFVAS
jgi:predicted nucleic acid-binding protein